LFWIVRWPEAADAEPAERVHPALNVPASSRTISAASAVFGEESVMGGSLWREKHGIKASLTIR
jgi:hypothetical protein